MTPIIYNIPVNLISEYRGKEVIVRALDPAELVKAIPESDLGSIIGVQLLSLTVDVDALADWGYAVPVELVMLDPKTEFPLLYRHAKLLDKHPVRVSIPVVPGFAKAVKIASSLLFTVKLELGQPEPEAIEEMVAVLDFYLHHSSVSQPIEYFHTSLRSFYDREPITLWEVQEEDPAYIRSVRDDGSETIARRLVSQGVTGELEFFAADLWASLMAERGECCSCEFFENCGGYFKIPRKDYDCDGVKTVFRILKESSAELRHDLDVLEETKMEA